MDQEPDGRRLERLMCQETLRYRRANETVTLPLMPSLTFNPGDALDQFQLDIRTLDSALSHLHDQLRFRERGPGAALPSQWVDWSRVLRVAYAGTPPHLATPIEDEDRWAIAGQSFGHGFGQMNGPPRMMVVLPQLLQIHV